MPTPLERRTFAGREVYLKREDVHELGAFKWRGALPALEWYRNSGASTIVTASTGNHGAACAWAARRLKMWAVVFAPASASRAKLTYLEQLGAEVRLIDGDFDDAKLEAARYAWAHRLPYFEDGGELAQYEGYGEIAREILDEMGAPGTIVIPVGNGALAIGIGRVLEERSLRVGVVAKDAPVMAESFDARRAVESDRSGTFADGLAVRVAIPAAVEALVDAIDRMLLVSEREIARAVAAYADAGIHAEGAAGAALAALPQLEDAPDPVVLIVTGRNIDDDLLERCRTEPQSFPG